MQPFEIGLHHTLSEKEFGGRKGAGVEVLDQLGFIQGIRLWLVVCRRNAGRDCEKHGPLDWEISGPQGEMARQMMDKTRARGSGNTTAKLLVGVH